MLTEHTLTQLRALKLDGMARAFEEQLTLPAHQALSFEQRTSMLVERELAWRDSRRLERLLKGARLKYPEACLENLNTRSPRGLDAALIASLSSCDWIRHGQSVIATGPTGVGKSWIACALAQHACRHGFSAYYVRLPRLLEELRIAHADGSFGRRLAQLAKIDVLVLDDWGLSSVGASERADLLEVLDDRSGAHASTIITSQLPVKHWHEYLAEPTLADAILDRIVHQSHRIELSGKSLRDRHGMEEQPTNHSAPTPQPAKTASPKKRS